MTSGERAEKRKARLASGAFKGRPPKWNSPLEKAAAHRLGVLKQRCQVHVEYRGKGVCSEWLNDTRAFVEWAIENGFQPGLEVDRMDGERGYSPDNCRIVSRLVNMRNRRSSVLTDADWEVIERTGMEHATYSYRLRQGWSREKIEATPVQVRTTNVKVIAAETGASEALIRSRRAKGWSWERCRGAGASDERKSPVRKREAARTSKSKSQLDFGF